MILLFFPITETPPEVVVTKFVDDVADFLEDAGVGVVADDIYTTYMPDTPDLCVCVYENSGVAPSIDIPLKNPGIQVIVRSVDYDDGRDKIELVRDALHQIYNQNLAGGSNYVYYILANQEPGHIGLDDAGRHEFSINFRCQIR